jgi:mycoredoxin
MRYWVLLLALGGAYAWQHRITISQWLNPPAPVTLPEGVQVSLYATEWCGYCARTRELLAERKVPYREFDIEKSAEAAHRFQQLRGRGVPVLVVGDEVIHGFDQQAMHAALTRVSRP